jgi:hypothetical protein
LLATSVVLVTAPKAVVLVEPFGSELEEALPNRRSDGAGEVGGIGGEDGPAVLGALFGPQHKCRFVGVVRMAVIAHPPSPAD